MGNNKEHLDIFDPRRSELFNDATHRDCEWYLCGLCGAEDYVTRQLLADAAESNPDTIYTGMMQLRPEGNAPANHCPGFYPSVEYSTELAAQAHDAMLMRREDMDRAAGAGRAA
jgi:hypothetical protein